MRCSLSRASPRPTLAGWSWRRSSRTWARYWVSSCCWHTHKLISTWSRASATGPSATRLPPGTLQLLFLFLSFIYCFFFIHNNGVLAPESRHKQNYTSFHKESVDKERMTPWAEIRGGLPITHRSSFPGLGSVLLSAFTLLVGHQEGHVACANNCKLSLSKQVQQ